VLVLLVGWFVLSLASGTDVGVAERAAAGGQALWPLVVVMGARLSRPEGH
jgi:hypothetical protein